MRSASAAREMRRIMAMVSQNDTQTMSRKHTHRRKEKQKALVLTRSGAEMGAALQVAREQQTDQTLSAVEDQSDPPGQRQDCRPGLDLGLVNDRTAGTGPRPGNNRDWTGLQSFEPQLNLVPKSEDYDLESQRTCPTSSVELMSPCRLKSGTGLELTKTAHRTGFRITTVTTAVTNSSRILESLVQNRV
ncbi:hypothetical protein WMY93_012602 [Mugilogobius chulae]|uniref:Uncharacterized protein n=1 Tax=Mugilogobius chulae TaxID=88201 RepID=A0AAW0P9J4_9GOBI